MNATRTLIRSIAFPALILATLGASAAPWGPAGDSSQFIDRRLEHMTARYNLTPDQQARIRRILEEQGGAGWSGRDEIRRQIDAVLTPAQRDEVRNFRSERMDRGLGRMSERLDLSPSQQDQVRAILEEGRSDPDLTRGEMRDRIAAVLTEEQRARLGSKAGRGGRGGSGGGWGGRGLCGPGMGW